MAFLSQSSLVSSRMHHLSQQFRDQPFRHVQIDDFLKPDVAESVSSFLSYEAQYDSVYGVKSVAGRDTDEATWSRAPENDRLFFNEMLVGNEKKISRDLLSFIKLRQYFSSDAFCQYASAITGLTLPSSLDARVHLFREGHYLRQHSDRVKSRRVAYILYLTPDWKAEFGGGLAITGKDGEETRILPRYNSLLMFDIFTQKEHNIEPVLPASKGKARVTMSAWLNSD